MYKMDLTLKTYKYWYAIKPNQANPNQTKPNQTTPNQTKPSKHRYRNNDDERMISHSLEHQNGNLTNMQFRVLSGTWI